MAKYKREFLVPYLRNVCSLHLLEKKIDEQIYEWRRIVRTTEGRIIPQKPQREKELDASIGCFGIFSTAMFVIYIMAIFIFGVVPFVAPIPIGLPGWIIQIFFLGAVLFAIPTFLCWKEKYENIAINRKNEEYYQEKLNEYNNRLDSAKEQARKEKIENTEILNNWIKEGQTVRGLLKKAYDANVIPGHYRGMYAAVYLYNWFSTSGADDLDHALSMFVLEEIKDRLDTIIENQSEMMLNQQVMIANQYAMIEQQKEYECMMRQKLNAIQATQEEQLSYSKMIECHTETLAFFAAADYIRDL
ncbi:MAG: hypothetical protein IKC09_02630 [Oscillospiraceae bacterium]|nr:hypothetical protein [Oscillospiraceae bacterium]